MLGRVCWGYLAYRLKGPRSLESRPTEDQVPRPGAAPSVWSSGAPPAGGVREVSPYSQGRGGVPHDPEQALRVPVRFSAFQNKFTVRNARQKVKRAKRKREEGVGKRSRAGEDWAGQKSACFSDKQCDRAHQA